MQADSVGGPYRVACDVSITRRKSYHLIIDREGRGVFRTPRFADVLHWLADREQSAYSLVTDEAEYTITVGEVRTQQEAHQ